MSLTEQMTRNKANFGFNFMQYNSSWSLLNEERMLLAPLR